MTNFQLETQILDYPIHQRRLMVRHPVDCQDETDRQPLVAQAVAIGFTGLRLTDMYNDMSQSLDRMDPSDVSLNRPAVG
jgi:acyl-CoA oxidase